MITARLKAKVKAKVKKNSTSLSTLIFAFISILTLTCLLSFAFMPQDALAGIMTERNAMMNMKKYSLWGEVSLKYENENINANNGASKGRSSWFTQSYNLNFRSYVISPRFMYYTIRSDTDVVSGAKTGVSAMSNAKGVTKTLGFETVFFSYKPFSFSLHGSRTDGKNYENSSYGLTMAYRRKDTRLRRMIRPAGDADENGNSTNNSTNNNTNRNANKNANVGDGEDANDGESPDNDGDYNVNIGRKAKQPVKPDKAGGLFSSLINTLPFLTQLDVDRNSAKVGNIKSVSDNASLRFVGVYNYIKTSYNLSLDYNNWTGNKMSSHKGYGLGFSSRTDLKWSFFKRFENAVSYMKNDITAYNVNSSLAGSTKKWRYDIYANYYHISNASGKRYNIGARMSNATPYLFKGVALSYGLGIGLERVNNSKNDFFGSGNISAFKRLGLNTEWSSRLGIRSGTLGSTLDFQTGIGYTFRPRKGHMVSIEIDPLNNTLKTQTFKPQVSGWDYLVRTGYTFGLTKNTGERGASGTTAAGGAIMQSQRKTVTTHRGTLNLNVFIGRSTLTSNAEYTYSPQINRTFKWDNAIHTTVMGKIGITLGTGLRMDMPEDGNKRTGYTVYNQISYRLSRTATLNLNSRYTKVTPGNSTELEIAPSIAWRWRSVFVDLEALLKKDKNSRGTTTERRIMLKVTRPFRIL